MASHHHTGDHSFKSSYGQVSRLALHHHVSGAGVRAVGDEMFSGPFLPTLCWRHGAYTHSPGGVGGVVEQQH